MGGTFILVYDDQASGKLGGQLPGLVDRAVIADFYLPYRCCSTVPPVLFEIAPPPLPDPDPDPEPEPEVEPTLTIGGTADDLVLSELDPPRVVRVTPRGGELTVSGAAGFELTPREESAGASDFEEWNFDPAALTFPDGGAESQTITADFEDPRGELDDLVRRTAVERCLDRRRIVAATRRQCLVDRCPVRNAPVVRHARDPARHPVRGDDLCVDCRAKRQ